MRSKPDAIKMIPAPVDDDSSEDVNDFLKRIRELGDQRDKEDEERNRRLEEEIIQGRKARQARREGKKVLPMCRLNRSHLRNNIYR